jgi:predicted nucleotidyltransferase
MTLYGLSEDTLQALFHVFQRHLKISCVFLFGSRSQERQTEWSDIDLAVSAPDMSNGEFARLWDELDILPLIYKIDCLHLETIENKELRRKILETGQIIWTKEKE